MLKSKYGIGVQEYGEMLDAQGGACAICRSSYPGKSGKGDRYSFHVDHSHKTGKIRGLLCQRCNTGLGRFYDSSKSLRLAVEYLEKFGE